MISEVFYERQLKSETDKMIYCDDYVEILIKKYIFENENYNFENIYTYICDYYSPAKVKSSILRRKYEMIKTDKIEAKYINKFNHYCNIIKHNCLKESDELLEKILSILSGSVIDLNYLLCLLTCYFNLEVNKCELLYAFFYNTFHHIESHINSLEDEIKKVSTDFDSINVDFLTNDSRILDLLYYIGCFKIGDLKKVNKDKIICICSPIIEELFAKIKMLSDDIDIKMSIVCSNAYNKLSDDDKYILINRFNINKSDRKTLEEIGSELKLTRERIRQKAKKILIRLFDNNTSLELEMITKLLFERSNNKKEYISKEHIIDYDIDEICKIVILVYMENISKSIVYDSEYDLIYNAEITNLEKLINEKKSELGEIVLKEEYDAIDCFSKRVVDEYYRAYEKYYILKELRESYIYAKTAMDIFPKGFKISDNTQYELFCKKLYEDYGLEFEKVPNQHSLESLLVRQGFVLCDSGTYMSSELSISLPDELLGRILDYIEKNKPAVFYSNIYSEFERELKELQINNVFYLKGCLDSKLPEGFHTQRNYIIAEGETVYVWEMVVNYMRSLENAFTKEDIKNKFPGVVDYVLSSYLYWEQKKDLVWLGNDAYIYRNCINYNESDIKEIREFILKLFEQLDSDIITSRKVYAKMSFSNKEMLEKLYGKYGHTAVFSILEKILPEFYYDRPVISKNPIVSASREYIVKQYLEKFDQFDSKMLNNYLNKMNIGNIYSYLEFMENMSDSYVQIDIGTMVKRDKFNVDNITINKIKKIIDMMYLNVDEIDTRKFDGYLLFPDIGYKWNKYLLVGIVRTYLGNYFEIINTSNMYNTTEFIIRRYENG